MAAVNRLFFGTICQAAINVTGDPFPSRYQDALGPIISRLAGSLCVAFSTTIVFPIWTRAILPVFGVPPNTVLARVSGSLIGSSPDTMRAAAVAGIGLAMT